MSENKQQVNLQDVDKAFEEFVEDRIIWWNGLTLNRTKAVVKDMKAFAKFYAKRCGVVFTESINQEWKDSRDVYKALSDFVMEKERTLPMHDADWLEFALYFAKRCGVVFDESINQKTVRK